MAACGGVERTDPVTPPPPAGRDTVAPVVTFTVVPERDSTLVVRGTATDEAGRVTELAWLIAGPGGTNPTFDSVRVVAARTVSFEFRLPPRAPLRTYDVDLLARDEAGNLGRTTVRRFLGPLTPVVTLGALAGDTIRAAILQLPVTLSAAARVRELRVTAGRPGLPATTVAYDTVGVRARDATLQPYTETFRARIGDLPANGPYTLVVRAVDAAGASGAVSRDVVVDIADAPAELRLLPTLGGAAVGHGVNDRGDVVGAAAVGGGPPRAALWRDGALRLLPIPDTTVLSVADGVNAAGEIVGAFAGPAGGERCYTVVVWTSPTSAPRTLGSAVRPAAAAQCPDYPGPPTLFLPSPATLPINDRGTVLWNGTLWRRDGSSLALEPNNFARVLDQEDAAYGTATGSGVGIYTVAATRFAPAREILTCEGPTGERFNRGSLCYPMQGGDAGALLTLVGFTLTPMVRDASMRWHDLSLAFGFTLTESGPRASVVMSPAGEAAGYDRLRNVVYRWRAGATRRVRFAGGEWEPVEVVAMNRRGDLLVTVRSLVTQQQRPALLMAR